MKKPMFKSGYFILALFAIGLISSCEKSNILKDGVQQNTNLVSSSQNSKSGLLDPIIICGDVVSVDFVAGKNIDVGSILISNSEDKLYVSYQTENGWKIGQTHLYVGTLEGVPLTPTGNPKVGQFPYGDAFDPYVTICTYEFNLEDFEDCFIVAAHAEVYKVDQSGDAIIDTQTAWSDGTQFNPGGSWASYASYCKQECTGCTYSTISTPFIAGQDIVVRRIDITNDADNLYVTYVTTGDWYLTMTHLYVGPFEELPVNKVNVPVPGHFPYQTSHNFVTSFTYTIPLTNLAACYIIAAHADVIKIVNGVEVQSETAWGFGTEFLGIQRWGWYIDYCTQVCE